MSFQPQSPRTTKNDGNDGSMSKLLMFGLIVLAVVASVLMLFLDSEVWLKISVIAALWAAFIGAVLATRYSSALKAERERAQQIEGVHNAELEREKSQFAQRQAAMETDYTKRVQNIRDEQLEQLRAELAQMRRQLAELSGRDLGEEDQRAVRARAERIREIENSANRAAQQGSSEDELQRQREAVFGGASRGAQPYQSGETGQASSAGSAGSASAGSSAVPSQRRKGPKFSTGSFAAVNWTGQDAQETSQLPLIVDTTALDDTDQPSSAEPTPNFGGSATGAQPYEHHTADHHTAATNAPQHREHEQRGQHREHGQHEGRQQRDHEQNNQRTQHREHREHGQHEQQHGHHRRAAAQSPYQEQQGTQAPSNDSAPRRGRRRADEASEGLTVAELMKRFKN